MNNVEIDLSLYRSKGSKVFTGRDRGEDVRIKSNIDYLEKENNKIIVIIPEDTFSINPSFLEEFLVNVVIKLGKSKFLDKFSFDCKGRYKIERHLEEAIDRILRDKNALQ